MLSRLAIITAVASAATAIPGQPKPAVEPVQPSDRPVTILASADHVRSPTRPAEAPKKPRAMRVTSCRCGDQVSEPTEGEKTR